MVDWKNCVATFAWNETPIRKLLIVLLVYSEYKIRKLNSYLRITIFFNRLLVSILFSFPEYMITLVGFDELHLNSSNPKTEAVKILSVIKNSLKFMTKLFIKWKLLIEQFHIIGIHKEKTTMGRDIFTPGQISAFLYHFPILWYKFYIY